MDRRIAYAHRKYHSGLIWAGVASGLAGMKLSGSVRRLGVNITINERDKRRAAKPTVSFVV